MATASDVATITARIDELSEQRKRQPSFMSASIRAEIAALVVQRDRLLARTLASAGVR